MKKVYSNPFSNPAPHRVTRRHKGRGEQKKEYYLRFMDNQKALKQFLADNFDFKALKTSGFFNNTIKAKDYEAQAQRICSYFGLKTIWDYGRLGAGTRYHITTEDQALPLFTQTIPKHAFADNLLKAIGFES